MIQRILRLCVGVPLIVLLSVGVAASENCDHEFQVIEVPATCTELGMEHEECVHCGLQINYVNTPALGHDFGPWMVKTPATCTKGGSQYHSCTRCGISGERETEATGHDYEIQIVDPQCTTKGYTLTVCRNCGDSGKSDYTEALGHDYVQTVVEPGCTESGYTQNTCKNCGKAIEKKVKKALGHDYAQDQSGKRVCQRCGDTQTAVTPAVTEPRETESAPKPTQPPMEPKAPTNREPFFFRQRSSYPGWFRLSDSGAMYRVNGLDPDLDPICGNGRVHFLWGFGMAQRIWLQWARMEV